MSRNPSPSRGKQKTVVPASIGAGAEDAKYQTKYKELKRKVKDVEMVCAGGIWLCNEGCR
jgi:hypothetical protein